MHSIAPEFENLPLSHDVQVRLLVAPNILLLDPGGHLLQVKLDDAASAEEYLPRVQFWQFNDAALPVTSLHLPDSQGVHVPVPFSG